MARWQPGEPGPEVGKGAGYGPASAGKAGCRSKRTVGAAGHRAHGHEARGHRGWRSRPDAGSARGSGPPGGGAGGARPSGGRLRGSYVRTGSRADRTRAFRTRAGRTRAGRTLGHCTGADGRGRRQVSRLSRCSGGRLSRSGRRGRRRRTAEVVSQPGEVDAREVHSVLPRVLVLPRILGLIPRLRWPWHSYILPPSGDSLIVVALPGAVFRLSHPGKRPRSRKECVAGDRKSSC